MIRNFCFGIWQGKYEIEYGHCSYQFIDKPDLGLRFKVHDSWTMNLKSTNDINYNANNFRKNFLSVESGVN